MNTTEDFDHFCVKLFVGPLIWAVLSVPCACVGLPASMWLLWVLIQRQRNGSSNNIYMLNLTVMDLIFNVFKLPAVLNYLLWHDVTFVKISFSIDGFNGNGRPLFMALSCVDCYLAVLHPIRYTRITQSRYRTIICALIWVYTLVFSLLIRFVGPVHLVVYVMPRFVSIFTITFCDLFVLHALRKPDPSGKNNIHPQKQRAMQTIVNSLVMTAVSYLPSILIVVIEPLLGLTLSQLFCHVLLPVAVTSALGSTLLPLLYLGNLGKLTIVRRFGCCRKE